MDRKTVRCVSWDSLTNAFEQIYPTQRNPLHYGTLINWQLGGNDPLEGISVYDGGEYCQNNFYKWRDIQPI